MARRVPLLRVGLPLTAAALALAQSGLAGGDAPSRVVPAGGGPTTTFVVSYTAPTRTGVIGSIRLRDELTAVNSAATGQTCLAQVNLPVPDARRGDRVRVRLVPATLGGRWCPGTYRGRVLELQTAVCPPGTLCPTYVRLRGVVARFSLVVHGGAAPDRTPPTFSGIARAFACTPGPQRPGETTPYTLSWQPASDDVTPAAAIVYDVYYASRSGGEDFARPTWTTSPGATGLRTPGLPAHGAAYFVVRARDAAGNEDANMRELRGLDPCV